MAAGPADPPKGVPADRLDRLYRGALEEFTGARNELAKDLKGDGKDEAAAWVKGLRKPTRAGWLVNQLADRQGDDVGALLELGEDLRGLQEDMLAGRGDPVRLRELAAEEGRAIERLRSAAETLGSEHGVTSQVLDRVGETFQAASSDPDLARAIELGRVEREQRASSLGLVGPAAPSTPGRRRPAKEKAAKGRKPAKGKKAPAEGRDAREAERDREREEAERRERREAEKRRRAAERELAAAEKHANRVRKQAESAREELERREKALAEAEERLAAAREEAEAAEAEAS